MKLLLCIECNDIFNLTHDDLKCSCGLSGGRYIDDINAEYYGLSYLIGFANKSLSKALYDQKTFGDCEELMANPFSGTEYEEIYNVMHPPQKKGRSFTAFIIPESAKTIKRID